MQVATPIHHTTHLCSPHNALHSPSYTLEGPQFHVEHSPLDVILLGFLPASGAPMQALAGQVCFP